MSILDEFKNNPFYAFVVIPAAVTGAVAWLIIDIVLKLIGAQ